MNVPGGNLLARAVGRIPMRVQGKLLVAFAGIVILLIALGALGLGALKDSDDRVGTLGQLQQRVATYRELQTASAHVPVLLSLRLSSPRPNASSAPTLTAGGFPTEAETTGLLAVDTALGSSLNDLRSLIDVRRLGFTPSSQEATLLSAIGADDARLLSAATIIFADDQGGMVSAGTQIQEASAQPAATELESSVAELVRIGQSETTGLIAENQNADLASQHLFIGVACGTIVLALLLGFILSRSLIGPIRQVNTRLACIAAGDFSSHVEVPNRDELGTLGANVNRMNDQLGRLYQELETTSRHKSEFLANMSHELRTPLNAIIGFSEVLHDRLFGELNDKQTEYVDDIHTSGRHLLVLINDILDLSKIEAGRIELNAGSVNLPELLEHSVMLMREQATRQGVGLTLAVDPALGVIEADERKLKQVLFNLLSNAVKFTERGGHIEVSGRLETEEVVVCVRDDGAGIAAADQPRIFEAFEQAGAGRAKEGTGLGLALSRRFVELHGGRLWVESEPGRGSAFSFTLARTSGPGPDSDGLPGAEAASLADSTTLAQS